MKFVPRACLLSLCSLLLAALSGTSLQAQNPLPYRDPKLGIELRVADLLSRMTLEEKVAQLGSTWQNRAFPQDANAFFLDEKGNFLPVRAAGFIK